MPWRVRVTEEKRRASAVARRIRDGLIAYNTSRVGAPRYRPLVLSARDKAGRLIGGLSGQLYWNVLYVELLWLDERARGTGLGKRLMRKAEALARRAGKELVFLSSYTFQAPGFYRKLGFRSIGRVRDYPRGESRGFFVKKL